MLYKASINLTINSNNIKDVINILTIINQDMIEYNNIINSEINYNNIKETQK